MKLKNIAYKLQKALCLKGRYIKINQTQIYSEEKERMLTKYILKEKMFDEDSGKHKDFTLLETFRMIDVVNYFVEILNGGG